MTEKFLDYLESIGLTETLAQRVMSIHDFYARLCPEKIAGTFVTEYFTEEGEREYGSLWFFSESYGMEALDFIRKDHFDIMHMGQRVQYVEVTKENYDFVEATKESRLRVQFTLKGGQFYGDLKASGNNCDYLAEILKEHVMRNLAK